MRPLMLHGHERAVTQIRYNTLGDLLFSVAKDNRPTVWFSDSGERLGTYNGHTGAVWSVDVNFDSTLLLTASADNSARLWDCATGKTVRTIETSSSARTCSFSALGDLMMFSTDERKGIDCEVMVYDVRAADTPVVRIPVQGSKVTAALWGPFDQSIIAGHEDGSLCHYDHQSCKRTVRTDKHSASITDLQITTDKTMIITSSKDTTAKLFDADTLEVLKTYRTDRPVNSAAIAPYKEHVVLGGGQEAMEVTTTTTKAGKFEARFFHLVYEEEIGRVKGHFGPINSLKFHPNGNSYSSGGEDGYVRVHAFDQSYYEFEYEQ